MVDEKRKPTRVTFPTHLSLEETLENSTSYFSQATATNQETRKVLEDLVHYVAYKTGLALRPEGAFFDRLFFDALLTKRASSTGHHFSLPQEEAAVLDLSRLEKVSLYHIDRFTQNFGISLSPSGFYGIIARFRGYSPPDIAVPYGCWIGFVPLHQFTVMNRLFDLVYSQINQVGDLTSSRYFSSIIHTFDRVDREKTRQNQWIFYSQLKGHYCSVLISPPPPYAPLSIVQKNQRVSFDLPRNDKDDSNETPVMAQKLAPLSAKNDTSSSAPPQSSSAQTSSPLTRVDSFLEESALSTESSLFSATPSPVMPTTSIATSSAGNTILRDLFSILSQSPSLPALSIETTPEKVALTSSDKKVLLQEGESFLREFSYFQSHPGDLLYSQDKPAFLEQIKRRFLKLHPDLSFVFPWIKQIVEAENTIQWKNLGISSYDGESAFISFNFGTSSLVLLFCNSLKLYEHLSSCKGLEPCRHTTSAHQRPLTRIPQRYTRH